MKPAEAELYFKIRTFKLDFPDVVIPFSAKLAGEYQWSQVYTLRAIQEYKKFIFLAMVADHIVSPSAVVDRVWHHHLLFTHSYWEDLCGKVLHRQLHHTLGFGGKEEATKKYHLYELTIDTYQKYFGTPPDDIWDHPPMRGRYPSYQWIDLDRYWVIPRPLQWLKQKYLSQNHE
jgi:hypothetical protein